MPTDHDKRIAQAISISGELSADLWGHEAYRFSAQLIDGTSLHCIDSFHAETLIEQRLGDDGQPYLQFLPSNLGYAAYSRCLVHGEHIESVSASKMWAPKPIREAFWKSELKDYFSMRVTFDDGFCCSLQTAGQSLYFELPDGRNWDQIVNIHQGFDMHPEQPIRSRLVFRAVLGGLPNAPKINQEDKPAHPTAGKVLL